ncbi:MAG: hypothetical protein ACK5UQ_00840 [Planctomycetota bacterium]
MDPNTGRSSAARFFDCLVICDPACALDTKHNTNACLAHVGTEGASQPAFEPAVLEARERWRVISLEGAESGDRRLKAVAKEAGEAHSRLLDELGRTDDAGGIALVGSLLSGNPLLILGAGARQLDKVAEREARIQALVQRRRACMFLLPELAKELAGPVAKAGAIELNFDEEWLVAGEPDRLNIKNCTDQPLTNATVQVDLRGRDGRWVRNVHFVEEWAAGQVVWANYLGHDPASIESLAGVTSVEIQDLRVSVWAAEACIENVDLHYPKADRDEDRWRMLDERLAVEFDYVSKPLIEKGPCIGVRLRGVGSLPGCKIRLTCNREDDDPVVLRWDVASWSEGGRVSVQSDGALQRPPVSVEIRLEVEGVTRPVFRTAGFKATR